MCLQKEELLKLNSAEMDSIKGGTFTITAGPYIPPYIIDMLSGYSPDNYIGDGGNESISTCRDSDGVCLLPEIVVYP